MAQTWSTTDLDGIPRLGWLREPSPVTALPRTAQALGLSFLGVKRDDQIEALHGGSKPRKLDYVLAVPPYVDAPGWAHAAGMGSGAMVALTGAARLLGRRLDANVFWTPTSAEILENLAFIASGPTELHFYSSRLAVALRRPGLFVAPRVRGLPVIPPGATSPDGMLGLVRAGLELGEQVRAGILLEPDRLYVALGSGGTVVGLALGLSMAGLRTSIVAVTAVERLLSPVMRLRALERALRLRLKQAGISNLPASNPVRVDRSHLGRGYAASTPDGTAACATLAEEGIALEPAYTGKAMAGLLQDLREGRIRGGTVLFWLTCRRGPLPSDPAFATRLPAALQRRLAGGQPLLPRRRVLGIAAGTLIAGAGIGLRLTGYPPWTGWSGAVLTRWEAWVVTAAAEALLQSPGDPATAAVAERVDRFLTGMPSPVLQQVHAMLALVEHGTPLGGRLPRFTRLGPAERVAFLDGLEARGGLLAQAALGLRDLCLLGYYGQPSSWSALGYEGPRVPLSYDPRGPGRTVWPAYESLVAPSGASPRAARSRQG